MLAVLDFRAVSSSAISSLRLIILSKAFWKALSLSRNPHRELLGRQHNSSASERVSESCNACKNCSLVCFWSIVMGCSVLFQTAPNNITIANLDLYLKGYLLVARLVGNKKRRLLKKRRHFVSS